MPVPTTELSPYGLQSYARKYFPKEFERLPPVGAIRFERFSTDGPYLVLKPLRMQIGVYNGETVCAYVSEKGAIYYDSIGYTLPPFSSFDEMREAVCENDLFEPFQHIIKHSPVLQSDKSATAYIGWDIIVQYYFALKGMIPAIGGMYTLTMFEHICITFRVAHAPDGMYEFTRALDAQELVSRERHAAERFEVLDRTGRVVFQNNSSLPLDQDREYQQSKSGHICRSEGGIHMHRTPSFEPSSRIQSLPQKTVHSREFNDGASSVSISRKTRTSSVRFDDPNVIKERRPTHMDLVRNLIQGRQAKASQSACEISLLDNKQKASEAQMAQLQMRIGELTSENKELRMRDQRYADLEAQHAYELTRMVKEHESQMMSFRREKESIEELNNQLEEKETRIKDLEADINDRTDRFEEHNIEAERWLAKAKSLYDLHKDTIVLLYEGEDAVGQQAAAIKAFEDEFGDLGVYVENDTA